MDNLAERKVFGHYVTETAFALSLTKAQINEIVACSHFCEAHGVRANGGNTVNALYRKGLIRRVSGHDILGEYQLTEAGEKVLELLEIAGMVTLAKQNNGERGKAA